MGKSTYVVPIVKRDLMPLWHDYWDSKKPSKKAKKLSRDGSLGQTATVTAKNKRDAAAIAEAQNPGHAAIQNAVSRIG
jgi:hypothetical protein